MRICRGSARVSTLVLRFQGDGRSTEGKVASLS